MADYPKEIDGTPKEAAQFEWFISEDGCIYADAIEENAELGEQEIVDSHNWLRAELRRREAEHSARLLELGKALESMTASRDWWVSRADAAEKLVGKLGALMRSVYSAVQEMHPTRKTTRICLVCRGFGGGQRSRHTRWPC